MKIYRLIIVFAGVVFIAFSSVYLFTDVLKPPYEIFLKEFEHYKSLNLNMAECSILDFEKFMSDFYGIPTTIYKIQEVSKAKLRELVQKNSTSGFDVEIRMRFPPPYERTDLSYDQYNLIFWVIEYVKTDNIWHIYWWSPRR